MTWAACPAQAGPPEPSYQGKKLRDWLLDLDQDNAPEISFEPFRHFNSNAVPFLVQVMQQTNIDLSNLPMILRVMRRRKEELSEEMFSKLRADAARAIGEIGPTAVQATPVLIDALGDGYRTVIEYSAFSLGRIVPPDTNAVAALAAVLEGRKFDPTVAGWSPGYTNFPSLRAAEALARVGAATNLVSERAASILALMQIASQSSESMWLLEKHFGAEGSVVRREIANALHSFGEAAIPVLLDAWKSSDPKVHDSIAGFVWKRAVLDHCPVTNAMVTTALIALLGDSDPRVRERAANALGWVRPMTEEGIAALANALEDPNPMVRSDAAVSLGRMGELAKPALRALEKATNSTDRSFARTAKEAMKHIRSAEP